MLAIINVSESAAEQAASDTIPIFEQFSPLSEKAVRKDGTIGIRVIAPGWGSSGYYSKEMLQRDIPKIFPIGTQMFWNHDTPTEESERPEGDLNRLAAVTVSTPIWLENGPVGPGMYADARPFSNYAGTIDEIGEHIGVSIRAAGRQVPGEIAGRQGRIIQELVMGKSVDFVTAAGAGGAIVKIFEAAGRGQPGQPEWQAFLTEAGRVLSATNEKKLRAALAELTAVLSILDETSEAAARLNEARNIAEWLESRLHLHLTTLADDMFGDGRISREERIAMSGAISPALNAYRAELMANAPELFLRDLWATSPESIDVAALATAGSVQENETEDEMSAEQLQEAQTALAASNQQLAETQRALATMRETLLRRETRDFVTTALTAVTDLPEVVKARLTNQLIASPPTTDDGRLNEAEMKTTIDTAVNAALAEVAAISGSDGRVQGNGDSGSNNGPSLKESRQRLETALAGMGYGKVAD